MGRSRVAALLCALALGSASCASEDSVVADRTSQPAPTPELPKELYCPEGRGETVTSSFYIVDPEEGHETPEAAAHALSDVFDEATATFVESERRVFMVNADDKLIGIALVAQFPAGWLAAGVEACAQPPLFKDTDN